MEKTNFEKLDVYKLSGKLADLIWKIFCELEAFVKNTIGIQLVKSSDNIDANIAEGTDRSSTAHNKRFTKIARGSLFETKHWLWLVVKGKLLNTKQIEQIKSIIDELSPRLSAYVNAIKSINH